MILQTLKNRPRSFYKLCVLCVFKTLLASMLAMVVGATLDSVPANAQSNSGSGGLNLATGVITAGMGVVAGKMLITQCNSTQPPNMALCAMGYLSYGQAAISAASAVSGAAAKSGFSAQSGASPNMDWPGNMDDDLRKDLGALGIDSPEDLQTFANNQLKNSGKDKIKINPDGSVTTPKGRFPGGAFASAASMADAGIIDESEIAAVDKTLNDIANKLKVSGVGVAGGGGGGSSSSGSYKYTYNDSGMGGSYGFGDKINAPKTSGLTRTLASGEAIGSSTDNIFEMVHRNYKEKSEEGIFVGQESPQ